MALMMLQAARPDGKDRLPATACSSSISSRRISPSSNSRAARTCCRCATRCNFADKALRFYDRHNLKSLRARALRHAENWLLEHQEANGSWGGIEPCYLLSAMALKALGYRNDHPVLKKALEASHELIWDFGDYDMYMPCVSLNWDTALAAKALLDSGLPGDHPALQRRLEVADRSSDFQEGRLVGQASRPRTGRMGVRVLQRLLSRRGRFGGDPVGAGGLRSRRCRGAASAQFASARTG